MAVGGILLLTASMIRESVTGHRVLLSPEILLHVWNQHAERLLLIVRGFGEPAEDAVQEAFVRLATQDEVPDETLAWMVRVARNQLMHWWRSDVRSRRRELKRASVNDWFAEGMLLVSWFQLPQRDVEDYLRNVEMRTRPPTSRTAATTEPTSSGPSCIDRQLPELERLQIDSPLRKWLSM